MPAVAAGAGTAALLCKTKHAALRASIGTLANPNRNMHIGFGFASLGFRVRFKV